MQTIMLPVGLNYNGKLHKEVELLSTNGIAEKIFTKKLASQPYTWQGYVLSVAIKKIGDISIGTAFRQQYLDNPDELTIPDAIMNLPLAEVNTLLVEIHRNLWDTILPKQQFICKFCTKSLEQNIDLNKITLSKENIEFLKTNPDLSKIIVYLKPGLDIAECKELERDDFTPYKDYKYNKFTYRLPLLKDAVKHEKIADDNVTFWRKIAADCLQDIESVENPDSADEKTNATLPAAAPNFLGMRLYDLYLDGRDLKSIREELMEYIPTLPFSYIERCPCDRGIEIPHVMEASSFFSE